MHCSQGQAAVEPMQVDGAPEENDNIEDEPQYTVENPSLVSSLPPSECVIWGPVECGGTYISVCTVLLPARFNMTYN